MIIYLDENISPVMAEGFNTLQAPLNIQHKIDPPIQVKSIKREFGQGARDEDWIPIAGSQGACIITQDYNINRNKHQRDLCDLHELGMFYFRPPSKTGFSYWDLVGLMVKHWPEIIKIASRKKGPYSYRITLKSSKLEEM